MARGGADTADYDYVAVDGDDPVGEALAFFLAIGPVASAARALAPAKQTRFCDARATWLERRRVGDTVVCPAAAWLWSARA